MSKSKSASALISSPMSHGDFYQYDVSANQFVEGEPPDTMSVRKHLDRLVIRTELFFVRGVDVFRGDFDVAEIDINASAKP